MSPEERKFWDHHCQYEGGAPDAELNGEYQPGGFHPVHIGDRLDNGNYEIRNKLGFGTFATVWLALDREEDAPVAIKIMKASATQKGLQEVAILDYLDENADPSHPGYDHVVHLIDHFFVTGPNRRHLCIVQNILGPAWYVRHKEWWEKLSSTTARRISAQVCLGLDYLHSRGIAHGDLHGNNILYCLPDGEEKSSINWFRAPWKERIWRKDGKPLEANMPKYVVSVAQQGWFKPDPLDDVQVADLGEAFFFTNPPKSLETPPGINAPELVFKHDISEKVDSWALGCLTYELITGRPPFNTFIRSNTELPEYFEEVLGGIPEEWIKKAREDGILDSESTPSEDSSESTTAKDSKKCLPLSEKLRKDYANRTHGMGPDLPDQDIETLEKFLRKALVLDPTKRASIRELSLDAWMTEAPPPSPELPSQSFISRLWPFH